MKIFVIGCSFSHHDVSVNINESWPALIQEKLDVTVINGSLPGSSIDSYYLRAKQLLETYGEPDHWIIQLTTLERMLYPTKNFDPYLIKFHNFNEKYTWSHYGNKLKHSYNFVTHGFMLRRELYKFYNEWFDCNHKSFIKSFSPFLESAYMEIIFEKELIALESITKGNVTYFSWYGKKHKDYTDYNFIKNYNYIGNVEEWMGATKFNKKFSSDFYNHFNKMGHEVLSKSIIEKVPLLKSLDKK